MIVTANPSEVYPDAPLSTPADAPESGNPGNAIPAPVLDLIAQGKAAGWDEPRLVARALRALEDAGDPLVSPADPLGCRPVLELITGKDLSYVPPPPRPRVYLPSPAEVARRKRIERRRRRLRKLAKLLAPDMVDLIRKVLAADLTAAIAAVLETSGKAVPQ